MLRSLSCIFTITLSLLYVSVAVSGQPSSTVLVGAGDIARCDAGKAQATAQLLDGIAGTVFTAGDNVYPKGRAQEFADCYGLSWGRHFKRTRPAPGNHDYGTRQAAAYFQYFGANAGPAGLGYYSYDLDAWHILSLNSSIKAGSWGEAQEEWLRADLAKNRAACTLAYWHHPYVSSGKPHGNSPHMRGLFSILYRHGADVAIAGHDHIYERFAPQDPDGRPDGRGLRQFIAGTGGAPLYEIGVIKPNSEVRNVTAHGVLKFTLHPNRYDWEFIPVAGQSFNDRGSDKCHGGASRVK